MAEDSPERRHRSRGIVFTVLLGVWLAAAAAFLVWAAVAVFEGETGWIVSAVAALAYFGTLAPVLVGVWLPGQGRKRAAVRRALVMAPVGIAGCLLVLGTFLAADEVSESRLRDAAGFLVDFFQEPIGLGVAALGVLGLVVVTGRVPLGRLFARSWLTLFLAACATSAGAFCAFLVCKPRGDWSGLESGLGLVANLTVLSWAVAFGLAVGATRGRNAAPAGSPAGTPLPEPPRDER
jgi:hypothetical protein